MKTRTPDGFGRRTGVDLAGARLTAMQESLLWVPRGQHGMHVGGCEEQLRLGDVNGRAHARNRRILRNEKKYWEVYSAFKRTRSASSRTEEGAWRAARAGRAAPPSDSKMVEGSRTTWRWRRYAEITSTRSGSGLEAPLEDMAWGMQRKPAEDSRGLQWRGLQGQTGTADREGTLLLSAQVAR